MLGQRATLRRGFTIVELLVVIGIIAILVALLMPVLSIVRKNARNASSKATMHNLKVALDNYQLDAGMYPIKPGGSGQFRAPDPGYYQMDCPAVGAQTPGDNKALIQLLLDTRFLDINRSNLINGQLCDAFGSPIFIRFLILPPVVGDKLAQKVYCWSYGADRTNGIPATPGLYSNPGDPNYDKAEIQILESAPTTVDDVTTWR